MLLRATLLLSLLLGLTSSSLGQTPLTNLKPGSEEAKALAFFAQIAEPSFDDYLKRVRLPKVAPAFRAEVRALLAKEAEVKVSDRMKDKLARLEPILRYHERDAVIELRVISREELFVGLQGRAVLLISETALNQLSAEELQAVVAHELGHEYFWGELMAARQQKNHAAASAIELLCDGVAVITLQRLGLAPAKLISAFTAIRAVNARLVATDARFHPRPDARARFIHALDELVKARHASAPGSQLAGSFNY
jgi:hypothetical protein